VADRVVPRAVARSAAAALCALLGVLNGGVAYAATRPPGDNPPHRVPAVVSAVAGTPCTTQAKACVDLTTRRAWLINGGKVTRGPVPISPGGPGEETPIGTFRVWFKDRTHVSAEQHGTPMPYSVFFHRGVAFHGGSLHLASAGCVHLGPRDAAAFYGTLRVGDEVQVRQLVSHGADLRPGQRE
jgi:hypothetical protein